MRATVLGTLSSLILTNSVCAAAATDVLRGKTALFAGDSITYGYIDSASAPRSWALRLQNGYGMIVTNNGQNGHSLSDVRDYTAYGEDDKRLHVKCFDNKQYDYVILQGGINDIIGAESNKGHPAPFRGVAVGRIAPTKNPADFDTTTFAGGLERYFYEATTRYPNARIGFIVTYQTPNAMTKWSVNTEVAGAYWQIAREICAKWDIPYLDLFNETYSIRILKAYTNEYIEDALHLGSKGYDVITPHIANWMASIRPYGQSDVPMPTTENTTELDETTHHSYAASTSAPTVYSETIPSDSSCTVEEDTPVASLDTGKTKRTTKKKTTSTKSSKKNKRHTTTKAKTIEDTADISSATTDTNAAVNTSAIHSAADSEKKNVTRSWLVSALAVASVMALATVIVTVVRNRT